MKNIAPVSALLTGVALFLLGMGLLNTSLILRAEKEAYDSATIGVIMAGYFLGFFVGTYLALPLVKRVGHIRAFACCAALISSLALIHSLFLDPLVWFLTRIFTGAAVVILYTVVESWLNSIAKTSERGKLFAIYMTVNLGSLALAQQLLQIDKNITFVLFSISSTLVGLSLIPVALTRLQQPVITEVVRLSIRDVIRSTPVSFWASFLSGIAMGSFWGLGALYAKTIQLNTEMIAIFISCVILGGAILQFPIGRLSDKMDRRLLLSYICISAFISALLVVPATYFPVVLFLLIGIYGGLAFAIYPIAIAHLVDHLKPEQMLAGGSTLLLLHGSGSVIGPLLAGQLMDWFGSHTIPVFWAVVHGLLGIISYFYISRRKEEKPEEHTASFIPMVRTTPTAFELLPPDKGADLAGDMESVWGSTGALNKTKPDDNN